MGRSIKDINKTIKQDKKQKADNLEKSAKAPLHPIFCLICGTENGQFYRTNNPKYKMFGQIPWCSDCLNEKFNEYKKQYKDDARAMCELCYYVDIPFNEPIYEKAITKSAETSLPLYRAYLALYSNLSYKLTDTPCFGDSEKFKFIETDGMDKLKKIDDPVWGSEYTQAEIDKLNNYFDGLKKDYDIVTTSHEDYARKISKISLEMDKALADMSKGGDDKKYQSLSNIFDKLCKSANFVENQKNKNGVPGNFGTVFNIVEKGNWIPEYEPKDEDTYDMLLEQFANIGKSL